MIAASAAFPTTREAAASDSCGDLMSRFSNDDLETQNVYHNRNAGRNRA